MNPPDLPRVRQKAGLSGFAKAGVVCGLLVVIGLIALALGRIKMTSSVEVIDVHLGLGKSDREKGENKPLDQKVGEPVVDRDATLPPRWVPSYPAAQTQDGGTKEETKDKISGTYLAKTRDDPEKVKDYFEGTLQADGFETEVKSSSTDGNDSTIVTATVKGGTRKLTVTATREKGVTNLVISYEGTK
ncbi:MAG: hypothetical protein WDN28_26990 [Chthoniobacter sp.]